MPKALPSALALLALALAAPAHAEPIEIAGKEFAFEPARIEASAGEPITITFENVGRLSHNLTIPALDAKTGTIQAGNTATLEVTPQEPGTYEIRCSVPGHAPAGMTGKLVVSE
jgi:plastocyanin